MGFCLNSTCLILTKKQEDEAKDLQTKTEILDQRSSPARPGQVKKIIDIDIPAPRQLKKIGDDLAKYISQIRQAL